MKCFQYRSQICESAISVFLGGTYIRTVVDANHVILLIVSAH